MELRYNRKSDNTGVDSYIICGEIVGMDLFNCVLYDCGSIAGFLLLKCDLFQRSRTRFRYDFLSCGILPTTLRRFIL